MRRADVIIVGGGLAGLSCGLELSLRGYRVALFESRPMLGGRTSSWIEDGMPVESGLHRVIGAYRAFPELLAKANLNINDVVVWEDEVEIRLPDGGGHGVFGAAPLFNPVGTMLGPLANLDILSALDWVSLGGFFGAGLLEYFGSPRTLDRRDVRGFAECFCVTKNAIHNLLVALTSGLYFRPPERYSAYAFFGTFAPYLTRLWSLRIGAFRGGMTEVMAARIGDAIRNCGGEVITDTPITGLTVEAGRVVGVVTGSKEHRADHVVLAASLGTAQHLIRLSLGAHPWFQPMLRLPAMPAVTVQMELKKPSMPVDRATFSPGTSLASFAEQSRTTFRGMPGRLSTILSPPERLVKMDSAELLSLCLPRRTSSRP